MYKCSHSNYFSVCPDESIQNSPTDLNGIEAGNTVAVTCMDETYELIGPSTVSCGNDGSWSDLPTCEKKGKRQLLQSSQKTLNTVGPRFSDILGGKVFMSLNRGEPYLAHKNLFYAKNGIRRHL